MTPGDAKEVNFGYVDAGTAIIGHRVWNDTDAGVGGDGTWQEGEPPFEGAMLLFKQDLNVIDVAVTSSAGQYLFENLLAGEYTVEVVFSTLADLR